MKIIIICFLISVAWCSCSQYTTRETCINNCFCTWFEDASRHHPGPDACVFSCDDNHYDKHCYHSTEFKCTALTMSLASVGFVIVSTMIGLLSVILCVLFWIVIGCAICLFAGVGYLFMIISDVIGLRVAITILASLLCSGTAVVVVSSAIFVGMMYLPMLSAAS